MLSTPSRKDTTATTYVRISDLAYDRPWPPPEDVRDLVASIRDRGMDTPILMSVDGRVIDGMRRVAACVELGRPSLLAVITDDFDVALNNMRQALRGEHRPIKPSRLYALYRHFGDMGEARTRRRRAELQRGIPRAERNMRAVGRFREEFQEVFGLKSHDMHGLSWVFRRYEAAQGTPDQEVWQSLVERVDAGEFSTSVLAQRYRSLMGGENPPQPEAIPPTLTNNEIAEQAELIERLCGSMDGIVRMLRALTPLSSEHKPDQLADWLGRLRPMRTELTRFIKAIEKEANK